MGAQKDLVICLEDILTHTGTNNEVLFYCLYVKVPYDNNHTGRSSLADKAAVLCKVLCQNSQVF